MGGEVSPDCSGGSGGWLDQSRLWDACLSLGGRHTTGLQKLSRLMVIGGKANRQLCDAAPLQSSALGHILGHHGGELFMEPGLDGNKLLV